MSPVLREAAISAAVSVVRAYGVRVDDPVVLHDSYNLRVHLRPAPIVARIPTVTALARRDPAQALAREIAVACHLADRGAPVVPVSDLLPRRPYEKDGFSLSFWTYTDHDPQPVITAYDAGRALADLHEALRDYPGELPYLGPALDETAHLLDLLDPPALVREEHVRITAALRAYSGPVQALHGDAHPGNLLVTRGGLLWTDFEETCAGPVGWDLTVMLGTTRLDGAAALRKYGADPDDPALTLFTQARALQGLLWMLVKAQRFPDHAQQANAHLADWLAKTQ